ncbi:STAS/SEC14 domain-containing protein [Sphingomonas yabuuchiae]|uniref:STAS/SEC14 domain-containing protein n=1 Tax=Sphingomonas yabuuchiae TaxID=172044 RepID=UPI003D95B919
MNLLDIQWTGHFTPEVATRYARELVDAFRRSGFRPGYRLRIDMSAIQVQPKDAVMTIHEALGDFPRASRIAMVNGSAVGRQQIRRLMTQPYLQVFDPAEDSLAWLTAPDDAATSSL